jgi:hypothetical protein
VNWSTEINQRVPGHPGGATNPAKNLSLSARLGVGGGPHVVVRVKGDWIARGNCDCRPRGVGSWQLGVRFARRRVSPGWKIQATNPDAGGEMKRRIVNPIFKDSVTFLKYRV